VRIKKSAVEVRREAFPNDIGGGLGIVWREDRLTAWGHGTKGGEKKCVPPRRSLAYEVRMVKRRKHHSCIIIRREGGQVDMKDVAFRRSQRKEDDAERYAKRGAQVEKSFPKTGEG